MFAVLVNGSIINTFREFGQARRVAINAKQNYTNNPTVTIEDRVGFVIEIIR